jgi:DNA-binding MarR family transcriptional regulator
MYHYSMQPDQPFIDSVRNFNRFYTNIIGLLDLHFLNSPFSLTEGRVLYEIRHIENCSAKKIRANITIDEGYLSRIIDKFITRGLIKKKPFSADRRLHIIALTKRGQREFSKLNDNSNKLISQKFGKLSEKERIDLIHKMETIRTLLNRDDS